MRSESKVSLTNLVITNRLIQQQRQTDPSFGAAQQSHEQGHENNPHPHPRVAGAVGKIEQVAEVTWCSGRGRLSIFF